MSGHIFDSLPVDHDSFRLLLLHPSPDSDARIQCTLINTKVLEDCIYEAVSSTWGEPCPTRPIFINEKPFEVRENLYSASLRLRLSAQPSMLWIDAVSIDQTTVTENGHQVKLMPKIYKGAQSFWSDLVRLMVRRRLSRLYQDLACDYAQPVPVLGSAQ